LARIDSKKIWERQKIKKKLSSRNSKKQTNGFFGSPIVERSKECEGKRILCGRECLKGGKGLRDWKKSTNQTHSFL